MTDAPRKPPSAGDSDLEREALSGRKISLAEALGRREADLLKGASPVTLKRQAELRVEHYLASRLQDTEGALRAVLRRRVCESEQLLASGYEEPLAVLGALAERLLGSQGSLRRFVAAVDAEWGRIYSERPRFERPGRPAERDDPYTLASVRASLVQIATTWRTESPTDSDPPG